MLKINTRSALWVDCIQRKFNGYGNSGKYIGSNATSYEWRPKTTMPLFYDSFSNWPRFISNVRVLRTSFLAIQFIECAAAFLLLNIVYDFWFCTDGIDNRDTHIYITIMGNSGLRMILVCKARAIVPGVCLLTTR